MKSLNGEMVENLKRSAMVLPCAKREKWLLMADFEEIGQWKTRSLNGEGGGYLRRVDKVLPCV
jgi:hypothetical protein